MVVLAAERYKVKAEMDLMAVAAALVVMTDLVAMEEMVVPMVVAAVEVVGLMALMPVMAEMAVPMVVAVAVHISEAIIKII